MKDIRYSGWLVPGKAASYLKMLSVQVVSWQSSREDVKQEDVLR